MWGKKLYIQQSVFMAVQAMNWKNDMSGGLADDKLPSDFDPVQLEAGIEIEMEHTNDFRIAQEIAMDHLSEDKDYYKKLKKIEG